MFVPSFHRLTLDLSFKYFTAAFYKQLVKPSSTVISIKLDSLFDDGRPLNPQCFRLSVKGMLEPMTKSKNNRRDNNCH